MSNATITFLVLMRFPSQKSLPQWKRADSF
jgi:hypothetical protein